MTTAALAPVPATGLPRWLRLAGWYVLGHTYLFGGALLVGALVAAVVLAIVSRGGAPQFSVVQIAHQVAPWLPFGGAVHFAMNWLGPQLVAGLTRRSFIRAAVVSAFGTALVVGLMLMAASWLERVVYDVLGWLPGTFDGRPLAPDTPFLGYLWGLFLILSVSALAGTVVGLTFSRIGALAILLIPVMLAPMVGMALLAVDPTTMWPPIYINRGGDVYSPADLGIGGAAGVLIGLAILAVVITAVYLLARRIPIRTPRA